MFIFVAAVFPCTTYNGRESGHPCLKPLNNDIGSDRNPLFVIIEVLSLKSVLIKFM